MRESNEKPISRRQENGRLDELLQEAIELLDLQRNRTYYKQDQQIENSNKVKEFIERHRK